MYKLIVFLAVIAAGIALETTPVRKCKNFGEFKPKQVVALTSSGVCTKLPCKIVKGTNITTEIIFGVKNEVEKMTMKVNATVAGTTINYPVTNAEKACDWLTNTFCPIEKNTEAELEFVMPVLKIFPKIQAILAIYLVDQSEKVISCFEVDIQVV